MKPIITFPTDKDIEGIPDGVGIMIMEGGLAGMCISTTVIRDMNKACLAYIKSVNTEFKIGKKGKIIRK